MQQANVQLVRVCNMKKWKRPESDEYPITYHEFDGKVREDGTRRRYWVQDMTEEYFEEVLEIYTSKFAKEEPLCLYNGVFDDPEAVKDLRDIWAKVLIGKMSLICLTKDPEGKVKIAGYNSLIVLSKDDEEGDGEFRSPVSKKMIGVCNALTDKRDVFKDLNVNEYLYAFGLYVLEEFRGEGIGQVLLKTREPMCERFNLKASLTLFSSFISQKQAQRCGFEDFVSVAYDDLPDHLQIPKITEHTPCIKFMYKTY